MISREEAMEMVYTDSRKIGDIIMYSQEVDIAINLIYDSIGSCNECKYGQFKNRAQSQCELNGIFNKLTHYCADFKGITND